MTTCECECGLCPSLTRCDGCDAVATWYLAGLSFACGSCLEADAGKPAYTSGLLVAAPACGSAHGCPVSLCAADLPTPAEEAELRAAHQQREPHWNRDWTVLRLLSLIDAARRERDAALWAYDQEHAIRVNLGQQLAQATDIIAVLRARLR